MKEKFLTKWKLLLTLLISISIITSCNDTETTDDTNFIIYYTGLTDIGPSMVGVISSPSYKGAAPSGFEITGVTLTGEAFTNLDYFKIDSETGIVTLENTSTMPIGLYKLSVGCSSNGKTYNFNDIIEVNMMKPVPDGIKMDPEKLVVEYTDVIDPLSEVQLPTAQITTDGEHVTIKKYEIAKSDFSKFFAVSSTGLVSIVKGNAELLPGKYILSFKLTTGASGEDQGIFENALEINIISKPLALTYTPNTGKIEEETALSKETTFTSTAPQIKGSQEGLSYSIEKVTPATDKILIDAETGVVSIKSKHGFVAGDKYIVDINVKNEYSSKGVVFIHAYEIEVVAFIKPVENFTYQNLETIQAVEFAIKPDAGLLGDEVRFEFVDLSEALASNLSIDHEGKITALKGNTIPLGTHTIKVKASNPKSDPASPTIASFTLTVIENINLFTYTHYGNNLNLTPSTGYANQFRISADQSLSNVSPTPTTDATVPLQYEIQTIHQGAATTIDAATGQITLAGIGANQCGIFMVTATAGKGTTAEVSVKTPVFFHNSKTVKVPSSSENALVEFSPFVLQVNPNTGGRSVAPVISGVGNMSDFTMDYRRTFNYYNFNGTHTSGQPSIADSFLQSLWTSYFISIGKPMNPGSRDPMSYYGTSVGQVKPLESALGYVDPITYQVVVNPNKWNDGTPANGAMIGQITINANGKDPASGGQVFPIVLWFDTQFK